MESYPGLSTAQAGAEGGRITGTQAGFVINLLLYSASSRNPSIVRAIGLSCDFTGNAWTLTGRKMQKKYV